MDVSTDTQVHAYALIFSAGTLHHHILLVAALHLAGKTGESHAQMKWKINVLHLTQRAIAQEYLKYDIWGPQII